MKTKKDGTVDRRSLPKQQDLRCYLPDENEIAERCAEIQQGWSRLEEMHRRGQLDEDQGITVPEQTFSVLGPGVRRAGKCE